MLVIRLNRVGVKRRPVYRIVLVDKKVKKGGKYLDILGVFQPGTDLKKVEVSKIKDWIEKGAKVSRALLALMKK